MEILPIFAKDPKIFDGLYTIKFEDQEQDEFERIMDLWNDTHYLTNFCLLNFDSQLLKFFKIAHVDEFVERIENEAYDLEDLLQEYALGGSSSYGTNLNLQMLFRPLNNGNYKITELELSKLKLEKKRPLLRIYAIRLGENAYVITGGAIKLTQTMDEHIETKEELEKINTIKQHLYNQGIKTNDDFITYYYGK